MSYFKCPDCGKEHHIFGDSHIDEIAKKHGINTVCRIPINPALAELTDKGQIEAADDDSLSAIVDLLEQL